MNHVKSRRIPEPRTPDSASPPAAPAASGFPLTIHPTSLSLRQFQRRQLERHAFFDGRGHITLSAFLRDCADAAFSSPHSPSTISHQPSPINHLPSAIPHSPSPIPTAPLRPLADLDRELAIVEAVAAFRASKAGKGKVLSALAPAALEETLAQLIDTVAPLADRAPEFLTILKNDRKTPKNPELAALYAAYARVCQSLGVADDAVLNAAILDLLNGPRDRWPPMLRQAASVVFTGVRWLAPFQESVIQALVRQLGANNVTVHHILEDYEQDWWGGALIGGAGRLLFGDAQSAAGECEFHSPATRSAIESLLSLREGYAMQDRALAAQARSCVGFSCSVGAYGEIEDLARRIAWEIHDRPDPVRPEDICLVTRNLGAASDAIINVFSRFGIPFYFRRGVPILSVPVIKTLVNLARFSATRERDLFCALLQSPWLDWNAAFPISHQPSPINHSSSPVSHSPSTISHSFNPALLADDILRSGVEPVMDDPDRIARRLTAYVRSLRRLPSPDMAEDYAARAMQAFRAALGNAAVRSFESGFADLLARCDAFHLPTTAGMTDTQIMPVANCTHPTLRAPLQGRGTEDARCLKRQCNRNEFPSLEGLGVGLSGSPPAPPGSHLDIRQLDPADPTFSQARLLNSKAWETVSSILETLRRHTLVNRSDGAAVAWEEIVDLLNRALENLSVSASAPDESGVWILNPYDVAGLSFKVVIVAGLNAGAFPKSPAPSPIFPDAELLAIRGQLQQQRDLPQAALSASKARNSQENLLFLTTLAAARERLVFSYAAHDESGQELTPSVFFSTLWRLVGWPALDPLPDAPPDPYDQWRLSKEAPHMLAHWHETTPAQTPFKRRPFAGESYLGTIPLALCRADDERRQRLALQPASGVQEPASRTDSASSLALQVSHAIRVERDRHAFFNLQNQPAAAPSTASEPPDSSPGHEYAGVLNPGLWSALRSSRGDAIPDLSPTQLERLVTCPYKYYLTHILRAEPLEPNELEPRVEDFGTAVHDIMCTGFRMLQGRLPANASRGMAPIAEANRHLCRPAWAFRDRHNNWLLQETPERPSHDAIPLVSVTPGAVDNVLSLFDTLAGTLFDWATSGNAVWRLGTPEQLNIQRQRIHRAIRNLVRTTFSDSAFPKDLPGIGNLRRYPALLEYNFDSRRDSADAPSIELADPADPAHRLRLHGKIDRVDLVFGDDRKLQAVIVVDYKGGSKARVTGADLAAGISTAAECQLPAYAMAATHALFPCPVHHPPSTINHQTSSINHPPSTIFPTPVPILMHYLSYTLDREAMAAQCRNQCIGIDGFNVDEEKLSELLGDQPSLAAAFTASIFAALNRYERGAFAVAPETCDACDFKACCRHAASLLAPESSAGEGDP